MALYKNALIAVDLNDCPEPLLEKVTQAMSMADAHHLCSAIEPFELTYPMAPLDGYPFSLDELQKELENRANKDLAVVSERLKIHSNNTHLLLGKASTEIKIFAEEHNVDLIILGTHGKNAALALLGSTSNGVLHGAPCDVLAIRYPS